MRRSSVRWFESLQALFPRGPDRKPPFLRAVVDGVAVAPDADGYVRLSPDFAGGKVVLRTR
jgi:hypothetical protein